MTDIVDSGPVVWPTWCYSTKETSDNVEIDQTQENNNNNNVRNSTTSSSGKRKRIKKVPSLERSQKCSNSTKPEDLGKVKVERTSPGHPILDRTGSPRDFPSSPQMTQMRRTMFSTTPPNIPLTPPTENCNMGMMGTMKGSEHLVPRNYSDFIRSLAAKYNNGPDESRQSPPNGFGRPFESKYPFKPLTPSFFGLPSKDSDSSRKMELPGDAPPMIPSSFGFGGLSGFPMIDLSSTQALINMVRSANAQNGLPFEAYAKSQEKKTLECGSNPLDLSSPLEKKPRMSLSSQNSNFKELFGLKTPPILPDFPSPVKQDGSGSGLPSSCVSRCGEGPCANTRDEVEKWSVDEVCKFVGSIDLCVDYVSIFHDNSIDGSALLYLTEDHLTNKMNMKLGPALKLRSSVSSKLGSCPVCLHCVHCHGPVTRSQDV